MLVPLHAYLSYDYAVKSKLGPFERLTRIELASPAWKAGALTIVLQSQFQKSFINFFSDYKILNLVGHGGNAPPPSGPKPDVRLSHRWPIFVWR